MTGVSPATPDTKADDDTHVANTQADHGAGTETTQDESQAKNVVICAVCNDREAVCKSPAIGWRAGCKECCVAAQNAAAAADAAAETGNNAAGLGLARPDVPAPVAAAVPVVAPTASLG